MEIKYTKQMLYILGDIFESLETDDDDEELLMQEFLVRVVRACDGSDLMYSYPDETLSTYQGLVNVFDKHYVDHKIEIGKIIKWKFISIPTLIDLAKVLLKQFELPDVDISFDDMWSILDTARHSEKFL